jgi:protoporphyrinogen oxidase
MERKKPIAILGAGLAGLTAGNFLRKKNVPFVLYEAGSKIAGLAASFKDADGFSHDFGAHFVTNRLAEAIGVSSECRLVKHYGEAVWLKDKSYNYPFGLLGIPRMSWSFITTKLKSLGNKRSPNSAAEWFSNRYGKSFAAEAPDRRIHTAFASEIFVGPPRSRSPAPDTAQDTPGRS